MRFLNWLVIAVTVLIAVGPIVADQAKMEIARWYLAAAVNAVELDEDDPDLYFKKAVEWSEGRSLGFAYWFYLLTAQLEESPTELPSKFREAVQDDVRNSLLLAYYFSQRLLGSGYRTEAAKVLEQAPVPEDLNSLEYLSYLNTLSYYRALAVTDLEEALKDIETALIHLPNERVDMRAAFLDTRSWLLYELGRYDEALLDINKSIDLVSDSLSNWLDLSMSSPPESDRADAEVTSLEEIDLGKLDREKNKKEATSEAAGIPKDDGRGALFYHRAKILEALGETEKAERDFEWLRQHNLKTDGSLF